MPFDTIGAFSVISLYSILPSDKSGMHHNFALVMEAGFRHASTPRRRSFQRLLHPAASDKPFSDPALSISRSQMLHLHTYLYKRQTCRPHCHPVPHIPIQYSLCFQMVKSVCNNLLNWNSLPCSLKNAICSPAIFFSSSVILLRSSSYPNVPCIAQIPLVLNGVTR